MKPEKGQKYYDETGIEIQEGDLLRVFHFRHYKRREKRYMYKIAIIVDGYMYGKEYCSDHTYGLWAVADQNGVIKGTKVIAKKDYKNEDRLRKEATQRMKQLAIDKTKTPTP